MRVSKETLTRESYEGVLKHGCKIDENNSERLHSEICAIRRASSGSDFEDKLATVESQWSILNCPLYCNDEWSTTGTQKLPSHLYCGPAYDQDF